MKKRFSTYINELMPKGGKILLAVSGGMDSVLMAHLCRAIGLEFGIAHCNFHLRGKASDEDEDFVKYLAEMLSVPCFVHHVDTLKIKEKEGGSTQVIARNTRYAFFEKIRKEQQYDYIATAHHINDSLETTLYHLAKGTGLRGLAGIPEKNISIIRPMQVFTREEIEDFVMKNGIAYREDASNATDKYARNKIRHHVVPVLKSLNPALEHSFKKTQKHIRESVILLDVLMQKIQGEVVSFQGDIVQIHKEKLMAYPALKTLLYELLAPYQFNDTQLDNILEIMPNGVGKQVFSDTHRLVNDRVFLLIEKRKKWSEDLILVNEEGTYNVGGQRWVFELVEPPVDMNVAFDKVHYLDASQVQFPLLLRKKQDGDVFQPFGMKGKKTLKKYFSDQKFSLIDKERTWVLCHENKICAVLGHRIDERFKLQKNTKMVLRIRN